MESWQSAPYEPPPPPPPPSPPQLWLHRSSVSEDEIISKHMVMELRQSSPDQPPHGDLNEQLATRASCTNTRNRLGNGGYLNQGIGYNVEYIGQGIGRANENFEMLNSFHPKTPRDPEKETRNSRFGIGCNVDYFGKGTKNVDPDIQRAFEKQKIREEIIAGEIARRRELEAEVREELRIEREMALRMKRGNVFDGVRVSMEPWGKSPMQEAEGISLEDNIVKPIEEIQGRTQTSGMENIVKPFQQTSLESKVTETAKEERKNNFLAKPSADLPTAAKESAYTVFGVWGVGNIEGKKVWRCFICQVSATSEADLKQHFTGSKHRSKRAVLKAEKSAAITVEAEQISEIERIATAKALDGHGNSTSILPVYKNNEKGKEDFAFWCEMGPGGANNKYLMEAQKIKPWMPTPLPFANAKPLGGHGNRASVLPENKNKEKGKEKFAFWCEMCNAGANNKDLMEAHKKGKKHLEKLQKKFPFWCDMCKVGAHVGHIMESHLKGRKHLTTLQEKVASTTSSQASKIV